MAMIEKSIVRTNASVSLSLCKLMNLKDTIEEVDSNIKKCNTEVSEERRKLRSNSQQDIWDDMLYRSLIAAYKSAADKEFVTSIKRKGDDHDDGMAVAN